MQLFFVAGKFNLCWNIIITGHSADIYPKQSLNARLKKLKSVQNPKIFCFRLVSSVQQFESNKIQPYFTQISPSNFFVEGLFYSKKHCSLFRMLLSFFRRTCRSWGDNVYSVNQFCIWSHDGTGQKYPDVNEQKNIKCN